MPRHPWFAIAVAGLAGACLWGQAASAAGFDCKAPGLTPAQITVCGDQELSQADDRVTRRVRDVRKRHGLGLYLGLRYWSHRNAEMRDACDRDRTCLVGAYRAQQRLLEKLQMCLDNSIRKRSCLRVVISNEETAAQSGGPPPVRLRSP